MVKTAQSDYKRYPKYMRGTPAEVAQWVQQTHDGPYGLSTEAEFWRDIPFLLERGYNLRPRYTPDWKPSWSGTDIRPSHFEDSYPTMVRLRRHAFTTSLIACPSWMGHRYVNLVARANETPGKFTSKQLSQRCCTNAATVRTRTIFSTTQDGRTARELP